MKIKKIVLWSLFGLQMTSITYWYIWGNKGIVAIVHSREENAHLKKEIEYLKKEIALLENDIKAWHADPYYLEKIAREELQLAHPEDIIFIASHKKE